MRLLTPIQKRKYHVYKETKEPSFPVDRVWKVWVPLPDTLSKGIWLQFPTHDEALCITMLTEKQLSVYLDELFETDGGW